MEPNTDRLCSEAETLTFNFIITAKRPVVKMFFEKSMNNFCKGTIALDDGRINSI